MTDLINAIQSGTGPDRELDTGILKMTVVGPCTLILGNCFDVLPIEYPDGWKGAVISDPPYGINNNNNYGRFSGGKKAHARRRDGTGGAKYPPVFGDDRPFDPSLFMASPEVILWGMNHYCDRLQPGGALVWVKRKPEAFGSFLSDAELAWMKGSKGTYCFTSFPQAMARQKYHPTQKPVDLMRWCVEKTKGDVLDPFMGSGATALACIEAGRRFVGIEAVPEYYDISVRRCREALAALKARGEG